MCIETKLNKFISQNVFLNILVYELSGFYLQAGAQAS